MRYFANSEDPDEMLHNVVFHQVLHCLLRQKQFKEKEIQFYWEIKTCYPSMEEYNGLSKSYPILPEGRIH